MIKRLRLKKIRSGIYKDYYEVPAIRYGRYYKKKRKIYLRSEALESLRWRQKLKSMKRKRIRK